MGVLGGHHRVKLGFLKVFLRIPVKCGGIHHPGKFQANWSIIADFESGGARPPPPGSETSPRPQVT